MANFNIDYLVVAGGGGGSNELGGGGGAGGYLTNVGGTAKSLQHTITYTVVVGDGGRGGVIGAVRDSENTRGGDGDNSSLSGSGITTITSTGGGGGGALGPNVRYGRNGGSGGGAAAYDPGGTGTTIGLGNTPSTTPSQGNNGGESYKASGVYPGGGGGGAGAVGGNYSSSPYAGGAGGDGLPNTITGASPTPYYAGGGGGNGYGSSCNVGVAGVGGNGGGGNSGIGRDCSTANGYDGTNGLGGGGGSATYPPSTQSGGSGGSGVVILRYATADVASYTTTGIPPTEDTTTVAGQTILSFTAVGTGSITFTAPTPPPPPPPTFDGTKVTTPVTGFQSAVDIGLKIPIGTNSNLPTGVEGMIRNDTEENGGGTNSTTAITFYNGTDWKYFTSTVSPDSIYPTSLKMYLNASDTASYTGTGTTWFDLTDNNNDGTISGATWDPAGYFDFNGISDKINLSGQPFFPTSTTQSNQVKCISAWVQPDATSSNMYIFSVSSTTQTKDYFTFDLVQSSWTGAPALRVRVQNGGSGDRLDVLANITATNAWTHVLAQLGSSGVELYLNGISQSVNYATSGSATNSYWIEDISYATSVDTLIGQYRSTTSGSNSSNSEGRMSKVRIYDSVLTQAEITALHTEGP